MKPVDLPKGVLPSHLVRRPEAKEERRETVPGEKPKRKNKIPTEHKSGDSGHIVDELA